jgi:glycine reductase
MTEAADGVLCLVEAAEEEAMKLHGKRVLVIGERDGVNAPTIEACVRSAGAEVLYAETLCFV